MMQLFIVILALLVAVSHSASDLKFDRRKLQAQAHSMRTPPAAATAPAAAATAAAKIPDADDVDPVLAAGKAAGLAAEAAGKSKSAEVADILAATSAAKKVEETQTAEAILHAKTMADKTAEAAVVAKPAAAQGTTSGPQPAKSDAAAPAAAKETTAPARHEHHHSHNHEHKKREEAHKQATAKKEQNKVLAEAATALDAVSIHPRVGSNVYAVIACVATALFAITLGLRCYVNQSKGQYGLYEEVPDIDADGMEACAPRNTYTRRLVNNYGGGSNPQLTPNRGKAVQEALNTAFESPVSRAGLLGGAPAGPSYHAAGAGASNTPTLII